MRLAAVILQIHPRANPQGTLLLLDEPMNSLDVTQQAALDTLLQQLCEQGVSVVMSSHDLNHTLRRAHRVWLLQNGKMIAEGDSGYRLKGIIYWFARDLTERGLPRPTAHAKLHPKNKG